LTMGTSVKESMISNSIGVSYAPNGIATTTKLILTLFGENKVMRVPNLNGGVPGATPLTFGDLVGKVRDRFSIAGSLLLRFKFSLLRDEGARVHEVDDEDGLMRLIDSIQSEKEQIPSGNRAYKVEVVTFKPQQVYQQIDVDKSNFEAPATAILMVNDFGRRSIVSEDSKLGEVGRIKPIDVYSLI